MKVLIKNMVSTRCKLIVQHLLQELDIAYTVVELGEVSVMLPLSEDKKNTLKQALLAQGFELLEDKKTILIEKIKNIIVEMIHYSEELPLNNYSVFLSDKLQLDYTYLSNLFSEVKGITIEHYIIAHKIERAKELIIYNQLSLTAIAETLHYSSVGHLSRQFKQVTGLTPTFFKNMQHQRLTARDNL